MSARDGRPGREGGTPRAGRPGREGGARAGSRAPGPGATRPTRPAGLALATTLLATLITASCVARGPGSAPPAAALGPAAVRTTASGTATPSPAPSAGPTAAAGGAAGPAGPTTSAGWRPPDVTPLAVQAQQSPAPTGAAAVTVDRVPGEWVSWALLDRTTGAVSTGGDSGTNSTESMVKAWIAADYLQGLGGREPRADEIDLLRRMIRDSDDQAAEQLYLRRGGDAVIRRLISTCGLTDTTVHSGWWSLTEISARDAVRMADCIADGTVTNARWTAWLLGEMRQVRGEGRFGIVDVRPGVAIKNGWTKWGDGTWHVNCLAVADGWSLSVLTRYPARYGLDNGAEVCRSVARQLAP
ncbi:serine hydrolase [Planosporangium sp. 12N6]|uniref:serine hydrolase n=1 Tax=Planosporangium spinosum TaxID=3402278 RepID=UPI003CF9C4E2